MGFDFLGKLRKVCRKCGENNCDDYVMPNFAKFPHLGMGCLYCGCPPAQHTLGSEDDRSSGNAASSSSTKSGIDGAVVGSCNSSPQRPDGGAVRVSSNSSPLSPDVESVHVSIITSHEKPDGGAGHDFSNSSITGLDEEAFLAISSSTSNDSTDQCNSSSTKRPLETDQASAIASRSKIICSNVRNIPVAKKVARKTNAGAKRKNNEVTYKNLR
ncbi:unnamed protein product [Allacma fusca]|uniref:Uncharacterized protein n=1 Tax=Allacma fusca TaxID=39272 RepID=A0A8J2NJH5_9HEXA|nr:unnamed protein product [Allacma fusca]